MDTGLLLTEALAAAVRGESVLWSSKLGDRDWDALALAAAQQRVLPMVYESARSCASGSGRTRREVLREVAAQTLRTEAFLRVYSALRERGLRPVLMKGLLCRRLYPSPDQRVSSDEDLLIPPAELRPCADTLKELGYRPTAPREACYSPCEESFYNENEGLLIELHTSPFRPDSDALGDLNPMLEGAVDRASEYTVDGVSILGLSPQDHMLFLLLHAFKHFIFSGVGIRQVCDIMLWAEKYGWELDWDDLCDRLKQVRALGFTRAVFSAAALRLGFSPNAACLRAERLMSEAECAPLIGDMLSGGVFGGTEPARHHSANVTVDAVSAQKTGRHRNLLKIVFPSGKQLRSRYPYLASKPALLPLAWLQRMASYAKRTADSDTALTDSVREGARRVELLRLYGIID